MKNREKWKPTKFVHRKGRLRSSTDPRHVAPGSRLITDIVARHYEGGVRKYFGGRLLDLGCGAVPLYGTYRDHVTENICVDWSSSLHNRDYLDFECDLAGDLDFEDAVFDTILVSDVLEHIAEPQHLWREMARVLADEGHVVANVPFYYHLHEQPHDYYRYTEFALSRFVEESGLHVLEITPIGGVPEILTDIVSKCVAMLPQVGSRLARVVQWSGTTFVRTRFGAMVSRRTAPEFPLGYFLVARKSGGSAASQLRRDSRA